MTISEISARFELTPDTLRYYERIHLIPPVPRDQRGLRNYDSDSCEWIEFIKCMRAAGLPIETLIEYVSLYHQGEETAVTRKNLLFEQRLILLEKKKQIEATIERLNHKLAYYDELCGSPISR